MLIRIQKYLSEQGICSRRQGERYMEDGLIKVNGKVVTELGTRLDPAKDKLELDGKIIQEQEERIYIAMHKPTGYVTTCAQRSEKPIVDLIYKQNPFYKNPLPKDLSKNTRRPDSKFVIRNSQFVISPQPKAPTIKVFPVGRLDKDSSGLIILTNDGVLAYRLTHPKFEHEKEYMVEVDRPPTKEMLRKLAGGIKLFGEKTNPTVIHMIDPRRFKITLTEGKNRHIRRICQKVGLEVKTLHRFRIGQYWLDQSLHPGQWVYLTAKEINALSLGTGPVVKAHPSR